MIVYKTTNLLNGKLYFGQDSKNREDYLGSGVILKKSIHKNGIENFKKETVAWCYAKEHLDFLEKFYIKFFNSRSPNGYNLTDGGDGLCNPSNETRKKIADKVRGDRSPTKRPEVRLKMSISHKGKSTWNKGLRKESDERVKKIADLQKNKFVSLATKQKLSRANKGRIAWNKGLTKEASDGVKHYSESKIGKQGWSKGLSKETDMRIRHNSESRIGKQHRKELKK